MGDIPFWHLDPQIFHVGQNIPIWSLRQISVFHLGSFWGEIFHFGPCGSTYIPLWHLLWIYSIMSPNEDLTSTGTGTSTVPYRYRTVHSRSSLYRYCSG
jgi:hypothetical protein